MSGHSKWSQIKHKKSITDQKKGALFSKIAREITAAARSGSPDPAANARLRAALLHARASGLPKENIARAIERVSGSPDAGSASEFLFEALGPEGTLILIEGITDNTNRSLAEIRKILHDHGSKFSDPGAVLWNFETRGLIGIDREHAPNMTDDQIELAIIDSGARDYEKVNGEWVAESLARETERVQDSLASSGISTKDVGRVYRAKTEVALSQTGTTALESLLDALSCHDDVEEVYTNAKNL